MGRPISVTIRTNASNRVKTLQFESPSLAPPRWCCDFAGARPRRQGTHAHSIFHHIAPLQVQRAHDALFAHTHSQLMRDDFGSRTVWFTRTCGTVTSPHTVAGLRPRRGQRKRKRETIRRSTTANQVATTPRTLRGGGWTGMLDGTSRPTNPEYEPDGIHK